MVLVGSIITVVAGGLIAGGIVAATFVSTHRDGNYLLTPQARLSSQSYAVKTPSAVLGAPLDLPEGRFAVTAEAADADAVFVGVGPSAEVADYLSRVHVSEISGVRALPPTVELRDIPGTTVPDLPEDQDFWIAASVGPGSQELTWTTNRGRGRWWS